MSSMSFRRSPTDPCRHVDGIERHACSAVAHKRLPRFDSVIMEHYLNDMTGLRDEVYGLFRQHPELLVAEEEGLSKEQHRELVRRCLLMLLSEGYSPLSFFTRDFKKYFYLAELLSLVDLSLVWCLC